MHVRCAYCRQSFNLSREYLAEAVAEATEKRRKYHTVECINCRKQIKVSIAQMKRFVPPAIEDEPEATGEEPAS